MAFHGAELFPLGQQHTRSLRFRVAEVLIGLSESMSAVLVTLCASKHLRDPELQVILNACAAARRFLLTKPDEIQQKFFELAAQYFPKPNTSKGPASTLKAYVSRLGWLLDSQGNLFQVSTFVKLAFLECPWKTLIWFAERSWQDKLLTLHTHRRSFLNFPNVDQRLTRTVLSQFRPGERRLLLREIAGAFQTRSQQAVWDDLVTPERPWCGQEDTRYRRFFSCTATQHIRSEYSDLIASLSEVDTLWPELPVLFEDMADEFRFTFQFALQERQIDLALVRDLQQEVSADNPIHVYTDGSCQNPTLPTLRHAGFSVVIDSCRSDEERCWQAQRFKETGSGPRNASDMRFVMWIRLVPLPPFRQLLVSRADSSMVIHNRLFAVAFAILVMWSIIGLSKLRGMLTLMNSLTWNAIMLWEIFKQTRQLMLPAFSAMPN